MKSKIEIRIFAVEQAVKIMGVGTPDKQVVEKAKEIENYVIGNADLPDFDASSPVDKVVESMAALAEVVNPSQVAK